jgi:hypothetical protein
MPCPDSEHNVTIVDKRIEDADNGIPVHHVIYRIEYGVLRYPLRNGLLQM